MIGKNYKASQAWLSLGEGFSDPVEPAQFPQQILRFRNQVEAAKLGLDTLTDQQWIQHFSKFEPLAENLPHPLALRYHGHQFTHYNPELGDGRGFLYAQVIEPETGRLLDLGTKGSGQTPYSRRGDGRLTLKGAVREALATAFLQSRGVNTSKTFSVIETGEDLVRHDEPSPTRSAVLVRLSHSHVRIGSFQRLAHAKESKKMENLLQYCLEHLFPGVAKENFFDEVCRRVAQTTAQWMIHGFVHGVMNTDNINITGESFDYGPYRFLPHYDTKFTAAYFDHQGLYAYGNQPTMVAWNLERLQEALNLLNFDNSFFAKGFATFKEEFNRATLQLFARKLGLLEDSSKQEVQNLFYQCLQFLEKSKAPYEAFFHHLYCWHQDLNCPLQDYAPEYYKHPLLEEIEVQLGRMQRNPNAPERKREDLETLLIDEIESIWAAIDTNNNWSPFHQKLKRCQALVLHTPCEGIGPGTL